MFITVRRYDGVSSADEIAKRVNDELLPIVSEAPGFVAYYAFDSGDGSVASVNIFDDQMGAEESNRRAAEWVKGMTDLLPNPPQISSGEVVAHKARMGEGLTA